MTSQPLVLSVIITPATTTFSAPVSEVRVQVKADPGWTLAHLASQTIRSLVDNGLVTPQPGDLSRQACLQSEAGEYIISKTGGVGEWFLSGDAFRLAEHPGGDHALFFAKKGAAVLGWELPPFSDPVSFMSGHKPCETGKRRRLPTARLVVGEPARAGKKGGVMSCKLCGTLRGPADHFRRLGKGGILLCPACFAIKSDAL